MQNTLEQLRANAKFQDPISIKNPEPWQWEALAKAFLNDPVMHFWFGERANETVFKVLFYKASR